MSLILGYVIDPVENFSTQQRSSRAAPVACLNEVIGLAHALGLKIVGQSIFPLHKSRASTFLGKGKVEEMGAEFCHLGVDVVIIDAALSAIQSRNLEKIWKVRVLDRTGLILEIFSARARSKEGRLQVELARLEYEKSRLVRSWTHLERQRGGRGFLTGPGETQIESDRRQIQDRIDRLKAQLATVSRTRTLHRSARRKVPYPIVALVGYTNAGKSSIFNLLTQADVLATDMLFATLDPVLRRVQLPSGLSVILSDTVGFISNLPTQLIMAFRATLEEVLEADLILHVRDISHLDHEIQARDVRELLAVLGADKKSTPSLFGKDSSERKILEVWNKIDLLSPEEKEIFRCDATERGDVALVSARTGEGVTSLLSMIDHALTGRGLIHALSLPFTQGKEINWIHENCDVLDRVATDEHNCSFLVRVPHFYESHFQHKFGGNLISHSLDSGD